LVKDDVERYLTGHARKGAHAGYGKQWIETLKATIEVIPNPLGDENRWIRPVEPNVGSRPASGGVFRPGKRLSSLSGATSMPL
jgi:hypothetical protein